MKKGDRLSTMESVRRAGWFAATCLLIPFVTAGPAPAQCPEEPPIQNYTGGGTVVCPCFIPGEQAGVVLTAPSGDYPIEVLRVGIGWGSQFGGAPQSLEQAVNIYAGSLPNPGSPISTLPGPVMTDGFLNEFDFEPLPGKILVSSGPVTPTIQFANSNAGDIFAPSVVHDGNGCQAGRNVVFAIPGGWSDACALGVTGDWVFYVVYRPDSCVETGVGGEIITANVPAALFGASPNPFRAETKIEFFLESPGRTAVSVYDVAGREVAALADEVYSAGRHSLDWSGRDDRGGLLSSGVYFVRMDAGPYHSTKKIVLSR